jgi:hypothetical protein
MPGVEQQLEELAPRGRGSAMVEPGVESSGCSSRCGAEGGDLLPEFGEQGGRCGVKGGDLLPKFGERGAHARPTDVASRWSSPTHRAASTVAGAVRKGATLSLSSASGARMPDQRRRQRP